MEKETPKQPQSVADGVTATLQTTEGQPARQKYTVTAKNGLFKNGKAYPKGSTIVIDEQTANNFKANGDVEDSDE